MERSPTYIARRRPIEMLAEPVETEQMVETWEGPRTAHPGDYIMTGVQGENWPFPGADFDKSYEVLGPAEDGVQLRVRKKILELPVFQTYRPLVYQVRGEDFKVATGYFIIRYDYDNLYPCEPEVFFETFEVVRPARPEEDFTLPG